MLKGGRSWREELEIIDRTMKAISGIVDPEKMVNAYFNGIGQLLPINDYVSVSRREIEPPFYRITRSSRFVEDLNPFTQRDRLPILSGGLLGEIAYANQPVIIDDLPARLTADDPAHFYLEGFQSLVSLPSYDQGEALNVTVMLMPAGKELDRAAIPMLHWQSGLFGRGTTNLVLRNQLASALQQLDAELQSVGEIQRSLLPDALPSIDGFEMAAFYQTSARAGGDYYDFFPLPGGAWGLFIADVSGHGTPAAVLMAITHAIAHSQPGTHTPPAKLLDYLNDQLARSYTHGGTFVTAFYAVLDPKGAAIDVLRAGHNPPRLVRKRKVLSIGDDGGGLPLGVMESQFYDEISVQLERGDLLLLYTDGITEAAAPSSGGAARELFGVERLDRLLLECAVGNAEECLARIRAGVAEFSRNAAPADDQTLIAIRVLS